MKKDVFWELDISVCMTEKIFEMEELVQLAENYIEKHEYDAARICLERAANASYLPAKYRLALLLRDTPSLQLPQERRYSGCEKLLLELEHTVETRAVLAKICLELSNLYEKLRKPMSCLGYLLRARRYGAAVEEHLISSYHKKIRDQVDLTKLNTDICGCHVLGSECARNEDTLQQAIFFLEEAIQYGDLHGIAALELAQLLDTHCVLGDENWLLAKKYYCIAEERGNPNILVKK